MIKGNLHIWKGNLTPYKFRLLEWTFNNRTANWSFLLVHHHLSVQVVFFKKMLLCISPFTCSSSEWCTFNLRTSRHWIKMVSFAISMEGHNKHVNSSGTHLGLPWLICIVPHGCESHPKVHLFFSVTIQSLILAAWTLGQWELFFIPQPSDVFGEESLQVDVIKKTFCADFSPT